MSEQAAPNEVTVDLGQVKWLGELGVIHFEPGDTAVLSHPGKLSMQAIQNIMASWNRLMPGMKLIVLEEGMKLGVLRAEPGVVEQHEL